MMNIVLHDRFSVVSTEPTVHGDIQIQKLERSWSELSNTSIHAICWNFMHQRYS